MAAFTRFMGRFWPFILFISLPFLAFPEIIFGGQTLYWSDLSWIHYPRHIFAAEEWLAGRVPLWDPYQHNGLPFLAESQVGALYPLSVLFLTPLSPSVELSLFIVFHFTLAASFTYFLARLLNMSQPAATLAGLSFGCGGFLMAQVPNLNIMTGAIWLPLILYGAIQTTRQRTWLVAMLAGIPLALQILTAQPQIVFYTLVTLTAYGLYRLAGDFFGGQSPNRRNGRYALGTILLLLVMMLAGLLLAAPQLLPTLELQQLSVRSEERGLEFLTRNSLPPVMWLNLLLPSLFGNNVVGFKGGDPFQEDFIYSGFFSLLLLFFCRPQRRTPDMPFFLLLLVGGALLAMGRYTPLYQYVIQFLPGFALFRIPARWLMVVNLALAILAGFGLQTILQRGVSKRQLLTICAVTLLIAAALALSWFFREPIQNRAGNWPEFYQKLLAAFYNNAFSLNPIYRERLLMGWLLPLAAPAFLLAVNMGVALLAFMLLATRKIKPAAFAALAIAALSVDLVAAGGTTINPTKPAGWWQQLSGGGRYVVENLEAGRVFPLGMGSEALAVSHLGQYFPSVYRVRSAGGHGSSLMLQRTSDFLNAAHPVQAIRVLGVRYLLTEGQMGADVAATYPLVFTDERSYVYENQSPLPRAFVVSNAIWVDTPEAALDYFETANLDPRQTVVLEAATQPPLPGRSTPAGTAVIRLDTPRQIEIQVDTTTDGYLVLLDTFYPGWVATVDAQPAPVYRANYIGRAVFVPAGQHVIRFEYRPLSFTIGVAIAALITAILTGLALYAKRNRQQVYRHNS